MTDTITTRDAERTIQRITFTAINTAWAYMNHPTYNTKTEVLANFAAARAVRAAFTEAFTTASTESVDVYPFMPHTTWGIRWNVITEWEHFIKTRKAGNTNCPTIAWKEEA